MARYVYRPKHPNASANGFVRIEEAPLPEEETALHAPILSGRFYEDSPPATDGTPINSRARHREYMKARGLTTADDFKGEWAKKQAEREARAAGTYRGDTERTRDLRETIGRAMYEQQKRRR